MPIRFTSSARGFGFFFRSFFRLKYFCLLLLWPVVGGDGADVVVVDFFVLIGSELWCMLAAIFQNSRRAKRSFMVWNTSLNIKILKMEF